MTPPQWQQVTSGKGLLARGIGSASSSGRAAALGFLQHQRQLSRHTRANPQTSMQTAEGGQMICTAAGISITRMPVAVIIF